jgi:hypothetical protein
MREETAVKPTTQPFSPAATGLLQRKCACGKHTTDQYGQCTEGKKKRQLLQRRAVNQNGPEIAPPIVHEVLRSPGRSLDPATRAYMEPRFGYDFSQVRIYTDAKAAESARMVNALAYTAGRGVVFAAGQYAPGTTGGRRLLAHELTHVIQQAQKEDHGELTVGTPADRYESEAERAAQRIEAFSSEKQSLGVGITHEAQAIVQRQTGSTSPTPTTPFQVCVRELQVSPYGNHAYIEAPPHRYAIISPTCPGSWADSPVTRTGGQKWDNSPDPCGRTPTCIPCNPAPGVTDVASCLRNSFATYANPSRYRLLGPNSNTFAGTLARTCCAGMVPKPAALGLVPGWDDAAPSRYGGSTCPPGPIC